MKVLTRYRKLIFQAIVFLIAVGICTIVLFATVETTGTHEFCSSCHEMQLFEDTWIESSHGTLEKGIAVAECVDCHLPHGTWFYLTTKARRGFNDIVAHYFKCEYDWVGGREHRDRYTYESGCKRCHEELVAKGIPIKAILAHRDYRTGETEKSCAYCHTDIGHGDLLWKLQLMENRQLAENKQNE